MSDFHFLRPEFMFLILPLAFLFFYKQIRPLKAGNWQNVISPKLQQYVLFQQLKPSHTRVLSTALWLSALLTILALTGPSWEKQQSAVYRSAQGIVIGLDLSLSMTAQDVSPSRIQRAKYKIIDAIEQQKGKNIGLIVYAGDAHVVSPLTQDINTIKSMLPALDPYIMPEPGSNLIKLANQAVELFEQGNSQPRTLLLVTDGVEPKDIDAVSDILNQANIQLSILAIGTEDGAPMMQPDGRFIKDSKGQVILPPLEWENLQNLASSTGAKIEKIANTEQDLERLLSAIGSAKQFEKQEENMQFDQWLDSGYWLVLPLLLLSLGAFRKGIILCLPLLLLMDSNEAWANSLPDVLLNADQQGAKYFANKPSQAAELFKDKQWKASSLYKSGDYQGALDIWQQYDDAQSLYNQGNALAQLQRFDEALAAYDDALSKQPDMQDAKDNKALIEQLMENQEQNQENASEQDGQQQDGQQQDAQQKDPQQQNGQQQDGQKQEGQQQDSLQQEGQQSEQQNAQQSDQTQGEESDKQANPLEKAQTDEEKQREEDMQALKEKMMQEQNENGDEEKDPESSQALQSIEQTQSTEQKQAMEQWMQRIPDDPSGLLRNKFLYQYQQRQNNQEQNEERKPW